MNPVTMTAMTDEELMQLARDACEQAYAPYSNIQVGCALISTTGSLFMGCNVENASYGLTICAERNAIFSAVGCDGPGFRLAKLAVVAKGLEFPPCGACRQVIAEFATPETRVSFLRNGLLTTLSVAELLPAAFTLP